MNGAEDCVTGNKEDLARGDHREWWGGEKRGPDVGMGGGEQRWTRSEGTAVRVGEGDGVRRKEELAWNTL